MAEAEQSFALRAGEQQVMLPAAPDAGLFFIGRIRTPWQSLRDCPHRGDPEGGPLCRLEVFPPWAEALTGLAAGQRLEVLYWLHQARRDLVLQSPRRDGRGHGTFTLRSPLRPNPLGSSLVTLDALEGSTLLVRGLDCLDGTPLLDLKPEACPLADRPAAA